MSKELEARMLAYEKANKQNFTKRLPIVVRLDGVKFSKFTKFFEKPFDKVFGDMMKNTALNVSKQYNECVAFTTHSDEISLFFNTYQHLTSTGVYNNSKTKIETVLASKVTLEFAKQLYKEGFNELLDEFQGFDARAFILPKEEVVNYFYSRQLSSNRNAIQMYARQYNSQKSINGKNNTTLLKELEEENLLDYQNIPNWIKYGYLGLRKFKEDGTLKSEWSVTEAELLKGETRSLLNPYVDYMILD